MNREIRKTTHDKLIRLNGVREDLKEDLKDLEFMRPNISDSQRPRLEIKIERLKKYIKDLDFTDLELREEL